MADKPNIRQAFSSSLLFAGLGVFSYFLLVNLGQFSAEATEKLTSPIAYLFVMGVFTLLGVTIIQLSRWAESVTFLYALHKVRLSITYPLVAFILLAINYAILVVAKLLIGTDNPLVFQNGGYRILIAVWLIELVVVGLMLANRSARKSIELQKEAARLQQENDSAKYEALQNQLNPHFLFNSLNTLVSEIEYNPESAVRFTRELSDVYRYVLQSQQQRIVSLSAEIAFLESYMYLHRVRMGDCITIEKRIAGQIDDIEIAPLSLQLLAENVIKHNAISEEMPMRIVLELTPEKDFLIVTNDLRPKLSHTAIGIGLKNLSNRYQLLCGKDVVIKRDEEKKVFEVKIPLIYE